jgi:hypothetical protein
MKLVKIDDKAYINTESVDLIVKNSEETTRIYLGDNGQSFVVNLPIKKVLDAICGSEEHLEKNEQIISEVINNLKKIDNISSVKIEYIRSDLGQPGGFLVQKN